MLPLAGITVVAVEQAVAAPLCTARLAEAGARVIKIEREAGDFARGYDAAAAGDSSYFIWINQGKESVVLDLKQPQDLATIKRIIAKSDVLVQNLAPGAMARMGLESETLRAEFPRLITCDISGYGDNPALADYKAYDFLIQGEAGLVAISGGENEMGRIGVSICDIGAGVTAHAGILQALFMRERSGKGSGLKISLFDVAADWMTVPFVHAVHGAGAPQRQGLRHPSIAPYGGYETREGEVTLLSIQNEREWQRFCTDVLGQAALAAEARFSSNTLRVANRDALEACIAKTTQTLSAVQFRERLRAAAIAFGAVNSVEGLAAHPALRRRLVLASSGQEVAIPASPIVWADYTEPQGAAPKLGSATQAIKDEFNSKDPA